jgi:transposase
MSQVHNVTHVPVHSTAKKEGGPCGPPSSFAVDCAYPRPLCHTSLQLKPAEHRDFAHFSAGPVVGDYRREHLFTLGQSLTAFRHYQELIGACDREIEKSLETFESKVDPESPLPKSLTDVKRLKGDPRFELRSHLYRVFGVDLTQIPGVNVLTAQTLLAEIGPDLSRFASAPTFTSWLGLCPDNRVSGGKVLSVKTRKVKNRAATALRIAAAGLYRSQSYLGHYFRRMRAKLGAPKAITAAAHKIARIVYLMLTTRRPCEETIWVKNEAANRVRVEARIRKQARDLGFQLVAAERKMIPTLDKLRRKRNVGSYDDYGLVSQGDADACGKMAVRMRKDVEG